MPSLRRGRLQYAQICLMGDDQIDIFHLDARAFAGLFDALADHPGGEAKYLAASHIHFEELVAIRASPRFIGIDAANTGYRQQIATSAIGAQYAGQYAAGGIARSQHHRAGPISKENTSAAILPIQNTAHGFRANHQRGLAGASPNGIGRHIQRIDKTGTSGAQIKGARFMGIEPILHQAGGTGKIFSGVEVATTIKSKSVGRISATSSACCAAL